MTEWIDVTVRAPMKVDADKEGCVLVWHSLSGCMVYRVSAARENRFITHWMPCPPKPEEKEKPEA